MALMAERSPSRRRRLDRRTGRVTNITVHRSGRNGTASERAEVRVTRAGRIERARGSKGQTLLPSRARMQTGRHLMRNLSRSEQLRMSAHRRSGEDWPTGQVAGGSDRPNLSRSGPPGHVSVGPPRRSTSLDDRTGDEHVLHA
jgi:hypothetical protein